MELFSIRIQRTFQLVSTSLFPNYGRKSYDYGEISTLLWGEQPANT